MCREPRKASQGSVEAAASPVAAHLRPSPSCPAERPQTWPISDEPLLNAPENGIGRSGRRRLTTLAITYLSHRHHPHGLDHFHFTDRPSAALVRLDRAKTDVPSRGLKPSPSDPPRRYSP